MKYIATMIMETRMVDYVAGLLFCENGKYVAMVKKLTPVWQLGKYNAIGGKIEPQEPPIEAMIREFREEAGVEYTNWKEFAILEGDDWKVHFFSGFDDSVFTCMTMEAEEILVDKVPSFLNSGHLMHNLKVLMPLALDTSGIALPVMLRHT